MNYELWLVVSIALSFEKSSQLSSGLAWKCSLLVFHRKEVKKVPTNKTDEATAIMYK